MVNGRAKSIVLTSSKYETRCRSGRAFDSESRGPGFDPHRRHCVVSLSKTLTPYITG